MIGEVKIKKNGETQLARVTADGFLVLPDESKEKLEAEQFALLRKSFEKKALEEKGAKPLTVPVDGEIEVLPQKQKSSWDTKEKRSWLLSATMLVMALALSVIVFLFAAGMWSGRITFQGNGGVYASQPGSAYTGQSTTQDSSPQSNVGETESSPQSSVDETDSSPQSNVDKTESAPQSNVDETDSADESSKTTSEEMGEAS